MAENDNELTSQFKNIGLKDTPQEAREEDVQPPIKLEADNEQVGQPQAEQEGHASDVAPQVKPEEDVEFETWCKVQKESFDSTNSNVGLDLNNTPMLQRIKTMMQALERNNEESVHFQYGGLKHYFRKNEENNYENKDIGSYESSSSLSGDKYRVWEKLKLIFKTERRNPTDATTTIRKFFERVKHSWKTGSPFENEKLSGCAQKEESKRYFNRLINLMDYEVARCLYEGDDFRVTIDEQSYPIPVAVGIACMLECIIASEDPASCFDKYFNNSNQEYHMFTGSKEDRVQAIKKIISEWFEKKKQEEFAISQEVQKRIVAELLGAVGPVAEQEVAAEAPTHEASQN